MPQAYTIFKTTVPQAKLKNANLVLEKLGLSAGDAFNLMLAQIEVRKRLPFAISLQPKPLLSAKEQADTWTQAYGTY